LSALRRTFKLEDHPFSDVRACILRLVSLLRFGFEMWQSGRVNRRGHCIFYFNKDWRRYVGRRPM